MDTWYSRAAYIDDTGRPAVPANEVGEDARPAVVYVEDSDQIVVGMNAQRFAGE